MSEKIRYLGDEMDFTIEGNRFLFFDKGHLVLEGTIDIKDNNAILSETTLKDRRIINSVRIDETQMMISFSTQRIQLKKAVAPKTHNELLKDYQGRFENALFNLAVRISEDNIVIDFQGKHFEGKTDVVKEGEICRLVNRKRLYDGKALPMGNFDSFIMLNGSLVLFTDEKNPAAGRITVRKTD